MCLIPMLKEILSIMKYDEAPLLESSFLNFKVLQY